VLHGLRDLFPERDAPDFVRRAVQETMGIELGADEGEIVYVRYRPTRSCVVLWSFAAASREPVFVSGRLFDDEKGARIPERRAFRQMAERTLAVTGRSAAPYRYLPDRKLLLQAFPLDLKLRGLPLAASAAWIHEKLLPALGRSSQDVCVEAKPLSYKPWRRCVFRYELESREGGVRYFGKLFRDEQGDAMTAVLRALRARLLAVGAPWEIAAPAAYLPEERMLVVPAIGEGVKLSKWLRPARKEEGIRASLLAHIVRAAEGLASFQETSTVGLATVSPRDLIAGFRKSTAKLSVAAPDLAVPVEKLLRALEEPLDRLPPETLVPTHGAFRLDQLLSCNDKLGVLDLDTLCRSGASADAGNFLAYVEAARLRRPRLEALLRECSDAFRAALSHSASGGLPWLHWYQAASLVKVATRSFSGLAPGWRQASDALLGLAEERLAELDG
jgi:hypothetical protein